jgi:hypothetical protein
MNPLRLSTSDRLSALCAAVVTVTGFLSVAAGWGAILALAVLAGIGTLGVVVAPHLVPTPRLPGSNGSLLVLLGVVALLAWVPPLIAWLDFLAAHLLDFATLLFLLGFVCAAGMAWSGYTTFRAEGGILRLGPAPQRPPLDSAEMSGSVVPDVDAER